MEIGSEPTSHLARRILQARLQGKALPPVSRRAGLRLPRVAGLRLPRVAGRLRQDHRALHDLRTNKALTTYMVQWEQMILIGTYRGE